MIKASKTLLRESLVLYVSQPFLSYTKFSTIVVQLPCELYHINMQNERLNSFLRLLLGSVLGIILGIALGLGFSLIIAWISSHVQPIDPSMPPKENLYGIASFLGMGFGAVVGAILGGITFFKKQ